MSLKKFILCFRQTVTVSFDRCLRIFSESFEILLGTSLQYIHCKEWNASLIHIIKVSVTQICVFSLKLNTWVIEDLCVIYSLEYLPLSLLSVLRDGDDDSDPLLRRSSGHHQCHEQRSVDLLPPLSDGTRVSFRCKKFWICTFALHKVMFYFKYLNIV